MSELRLRIATWNILHGMDLRRGGRQDLDAVAAEIARYKADLVALQEVDEQQPRSGDVSQIRELAQRLGWHGTFAPALIGSPDSRWLVPQRDRSAAVSEKGPAYGVGLLSRHPITAVRRLRLPGGGDGARSATPSSTNPGWDREPRVALNAKVAIDGVMLHVTTTHLSYLPWRGLRQLRHAAGAAAADGTPSILLGDLNLPAWAVRAAAPRWTHAGGAPTYRADRPQLQVDQILVRGLDVVDVRVGAPAGSDHLALIADLSLAPPAV